MNRCMPPLAILLLCSALAIGVGCGKTPSSDGAAPTASAPPAGPAYETAEELLAWLKTLRTGEDRLAMIDLVHTETTTEQMTKRYMRSTDRARLEYARAINEAFAADGEEIMPADLGMGAFHQAMQNAAVEQISPVRVRITCTIEDGEDLVIILERWGTWQVHVSTLRNGEDVNPVWYSMNQDRLGGLLKYHRDVTEQIRAGDFASAEAAQARLDELLAGRMPPIGSVPPD